MALLSDKIIHKSRKEAICGVCNMVMPKRHSTAGYKMD